MNTTDSDDNSSSKDNVEADREVIRRSLDQLAAKVETALREASLGFPIYLAVPNSGNSILTFATPLDPSDPDWGQAADIVCRIVAERLHVNRLDSRSLQCAVANSKLAVADLNHSPTCG